MAPLLAPLLAGALVAGVLAGMVAAQTREPDLQGGLGVGNGAPRLQVQKWVSGGPVDMPRNGKGGILLLVFVAAGDPGAPRLLASLDKVQAEHRDAGVHIVVVPVAEENPGARDAPGTLVTSNHLSLRVAQDTAGATARVYLGKAKGGAKGKPAGKLPQAFLINHLGLITWVGSPERGLFAPLHQALAVARDKELVAQLRATQAALGQAQGNRDHKMIESITKDLIAIGARHSAPWIHRFRAAVDFKNDAQRAREIAVAALKDLAVRPNQMVHFANECLLRDLDNVYYHQIVLMALTPAAAQEPENVAVQLAYARALAGCGNVKQATTVARRVVPLLGDNPTELQRCAQQLTDTRLPQAFGDTALAAVERAIELKGASRNLLIVKYRILHAGKRDLQAAQKVGQQIIAPMRENNSALNTFAWDLLTEEPYKGRFSSLALLATNAMEANGRGITYYMLDTIALAKFENGYLDEAIAYQKRAMAGGGKGDPDYHRRMETYLKARRARDEARNKKR